MIIWTLPVVFTLSEVDALMSLYSTVLDLLSDSRLILTDFGSNLRLSLSLFNALGNDPSIIQGKMRITRILFYVLTPAFGSCIQASVYHNRQGVGINQPELIELEKQIYKECPSGIISS